MQISRGLVFYDGKHFEDSFDSGTDRSNFVLDIPTLDIHQGAFKEVDYKFSLSLFFFLKKTYRPISVMFAIQYGLYCLKLAYWM